MTEDDLKKRTKEFALRVIKLVQSLPNTPLARHIGGQLMRCDESVFWIELLVDTELVRLKRVADLLDEANQLVAIFVSSINTARKKTR